MGRLGLSLGNLRAPFGRPPGPQSHKLVVPRHPKAYCHLLCATLPMHSGLSPRTQQHTSPQGAQAAWLGRVPTKGFHTKRGLYLIHSRLIVLPSLRIGSTIIICIWFLAGFRPNLATRPVPTGQARQMMQNAPKISPEEKNGRSFHGHFLILVKKT